MPNLEIHFTGLCLFVRHPNDSMVDVRFVTTAHEHGHGVVPHFPILAIPSNVWKSTTPDDGSRPGRGAGRPIHLYLEDTWRLLIDGAPLTGKVNVIDSGGTSGSLPSTWQDMQYVLRASDVYPGHQFDAALADSAAPVGRLTLNGGMLFGGLPTTQVDDHPWEWLDSNGTPLGKSAFFTDKVTYRVPFESKIEVHRREVVPGGALDSLVELRSTTDFAMWVVHDPFSMTRKGHRPKEIEHLGLFRPCFNSHMPPDPRRFRQSPGAPLMSPKAGGCKPMQATL